MLPKFVISGLLAVSLFAQGLPLSACCCMAKAEPASVAKPSCPRCIAKLDVERQAPVARTPRTAERETKASVCGHSGSSCPCCMKRATTRAIVQPTADLPERPAPQLIESIEPLAALRGDSDSGVALDAVPDARPGLPKRIWGCVWRI